MIRFAATLLAVAGAPLAAADRSYSVSDFDEIRLIGPHRVTVSPGRATSVKASGTSAALDTLSVETMGRALIIQSKTQIAAGSTVPPRTAATVTITLPALKSVRVQGSGRIDAAIMRGAQANIALMGSGAINVAKIEADRASLRLTGSGRITTAGKVKNLTVDVKGAGELAAEQLTAMDVRLVSATSGRAALTATRSANVSAIGSGETTVFGKAACVVKNNGTGVVSCGGK